MQLRFRNLDLSTNFKAKTKTKVKPVNKPQVIKINIHKLKDMCPRTRMLYTTLQQCFNELGDCDVFVGNEKVVLMCIVMERAMNMTIQNKTLLINLALIYQPWETYVYETRVKCVLILAKVKFAEANSKKWTVWEKEKLNNFYNILHKVQLEFPIE